MRTRPDLLFFSPVVPDPGSIGLAQRAALFVRALARRYRIRLHVLPVFGPVSGADGGPLRDLYAEVIVEPLEAHEDPRFRMVCKIQNPRHRFAALIGYPDPVPCRYATARAVADVAGRHPSVEAVHVFRLYLAPFARPFLERSEGSRPVCRLDLDDHESLTRQRLAALAERTGRPADAQLERSEAGKFEALEDAWLPRFDTVFVAGDGARDRLARRCPAASFVEVPNAVSLPPPPPVGGGRSTILLLGTMNYGPNEDAACYFCEQVLPLVRARRAEPVRMVIAGTSPTAAVRQLARLPEVTVTGWVADVGPLYAQADLVVAPLRAGGGTRIKILEAFAHRRPVVATRIGVEGILARDGEHLLVRDTPEDFAAACVRLLDAPDEAARLVERASALIRSTYEESVVMDAIERLTLPHRRRSP